MPVCLNLYVIDHKGDIFRKWVGKPGEKSVDAAIAKLIPEAENQEPPRVEAFFAFEKTSWRPDDKAIAISKTTKTVLLLIIVSFGAAIPVGGFVFGCIAPVPIAGGDGTVFGMVLGRVSFGLSFALQTTLAIGFPEPGGAGSGYRLNVWPYIAATYLPVLVTNFFVAWCCGLFRRQPGG